jgi:hypothetical protein
VEEPVAVEQPTVVVDSEVVELKKTKKAPSKKKPAAPPKAKAVKK